MNQPPHAYTDFHPRWYRPRISTYWWMDRWPYLTFILRELSSVFVAWAVVYLLFLIQALSRGESHYYHFLNWSAEPGIVLLNVVAVAFLCFHAVTWFNLAPQAMIVHMRGKRVPGTWIAISNYVAWAVVSVLVIWLLGART